MGCGCAESFLSITLMLGSITIGLASIAYGVGRIAYILEKRK